MVIADTHVLIQDALAPQRLSPRARRTIDREARQGTLAASDISLWEIAMLVAKGRLDPGKDAKAFLDDLILGRRLAILPITTAIAVRAQSDEFAQGDPADRIIAATALERGAPLITADSGLTRLRGLKVIW